LNLAEDLDNIKSRFDNLVVSAQQVLQSQGFPQENVEIELYLNLRYQGTDNAMMTLKPANGWDFKGVFLEQYQTEFGFTLPDRMILVDDVRVRAIGKSPATGRSESWTGVHEELKSIVRSPAVSMKSVSAYWNTIGRVQTPLYELKQLKIGDEVVGPAIIIDATATIAVEPYCSAVVSSEHVVGYVDDKKQSDVGTKMDPIMLSIFGHRFMSIAEQMGRTLQKTSVSTNIKERLDFSCALFGPDGGLVANAPHIPVHLGSMQEAVKWQMNNTVINEGDVILSNHPSAGGSHLPDVFVC
jgi:5-oxoprolinase (ATP-hydrolysing)